jgi:proteasome alpha subunit
MLDVDRLEVAVLDRSRPNRAFRRISGAALASLLPSSGETPAEEATPADEGPEPPVTPHSPGDKD